MNISPSSPRVDTQRSPALPEALADDAATTSEQLLAAPSTLSALLAAGRRPEERSPSVPSHPPGSPPAGPGSVPADMVRATLEARQAALDRLSATDPAVTVPDPIAGPVTAAVERDAESSTTSVLVRVDSRREVLLTREANGRIDAWSVIDGELGRQLRPGTETELPRGASEEAYSSGFGRIVVTPGAEGSALFIDHDVNWSIDGGHRTIVVSSDLSTLDVQRHTDAYISLFGSSGPTDRFERYDLDGGDLLVSEGAPRFESMTPGQRFSFYVGTPEGRRLVREEGAGARSLVFDFNPTPPSSELYPDAESRALFVARARYLRGEGGPELFDAFTPRRAGLEGAALAAHDAEVRKVMAHIEAESVNTSNGETLDRSLRYIIASGLVEALGADSARIDQGLAIQTGGWIVSHDGQSGISRPTVNGTYFPTGFPNNITDGNATGFRLSSLISSYVRPDDGFELIGHEFAHGLDLADGGFDGIPIDLPPADVAVVNAERVRINDIYTASGELDTSGLDGHAFSNELEFWAEASERYLSGSAGAEVVLRNAPELHAVLERYYGFPYG